MTILSPNQIATLIYMAGDFGPFLGVTDTQGPHGQITPHIPAPGSPQRTKAENWLDTAIAICLAESGGNTHAHNPSGAVGLWQIMQSVHQKEIHDAIVYWDTQTGKKLNVYDGRVNTMAASHVYQNAGNSWSPWTTFTSGAYKKHTGNGKSAYAFLTNQKHLKAQIDNLNNELNLDHFTAGIGGLLGNQVTGQNILPSLKNLLPSWLDPIMNFIKEGALAVGVFILGLLLIGIGIWHYMNHTSSGRSIKKSISKAALVIPK